LLIPLVSSFRRFPVSQCTALARYMSTDGGLAPKKIYLAVNYDSKDAAKSKGAKWDMAAKKW
jgi:hypothetical protein